MSQRARRTAGNVVIGAELARNQGWQKTTAYTGAGIGGLLVISKDMTDYLKHGPPWLAPLFVTCLIVAAASLGRSYIGLVSAERQLIAYQKEHDKKDIDEVPDQDLAFPVDAYFFFWTAFMLSAFAAGMLLFALWAYPLK